jgi:5-methylcytosine-specific restriction endonuclease McrA
MKFKLVDKERRVSREWSREMDEKIERTVLTLAEWIFMHESERTAWLDRAFQIGLDRITPTSDDPLASMAHVVRRTLHSQQKLFATRVRQKERQKVRRPAEWARLRYEIILKRGNRCECCGRSPPEVEIHVDHIKPVSKHPELALEPSNLQVLCKECNYAKNAIDETDWRKS